MQQQPIVLVFDIGGKVRISPPIWPNKKLDVQPGDLSKFAPQGNGVYGYQNSERVGNVFTKAPPQDACGGAIYFDTNITKADFEALMRITGVQPAYVVKPSKDFAIFGTESKEPGKDGYIAQVRIVHKFALQYMFGAISDGEYKNFPEQEMTVVEALWQFIEYEKKRWGTHFTNDKKSSLAGKFGGDGDFAREQLSFGFMVENDYHNVYRIWSRAWLVTK